MFLLQLSLPVSTRHFFRESFNSHWLLLFPSCSSFMGSKLGKKTPKAGGLPSPKASAETTDLAAKKQRKKKRKKKLPKNYNPNVDPDPERWLPR